MTTGVLHIRPRRKKELRYEADTRMRARSKVSGELGFTIVELMLALGLGGILLLGVLALCSYYNQYFAYSRALSTRNELIAEVKAFGSSLSVLQASAQAPENSDLANCLSGVACNTIALPLALYAPNSLASQSALSGTASNPRFYNINGSPCPRSMTVPTSQCPLEVYTSFVPQCPASPPASMVPSSTCSGVPPDVIVVIYTVQQAEGISLGPNGVGQLAPFSGTIIVQGPYL